MTRIYLSSLLLLALCTAVPATARAGELPASVQQSGYALQAIGKGRLTWLGFGIYEAGLWSADGQIDPRQPDAPVALTLWYERKFSRQQLLDITTGEWERLGLGRPDARAAWARQLDTIWRDVGRGDNLTAVVLPGRETRFYDGQQLLGRVQDPDFGPAFLGIWLDPDSAVGELRVALLGEDGKP